MIFLRLICEKIESYLSCNKRVGCRKYYFLETITGTEVVIIFFFQSLLRACTYEGGMVKQDEGGMGRMGERNRLAQRLILDVQNITCNTPTSLGILRFSPSLSHSSFLFLIIIFSLTCGCEYYCLIFVSLIICTFLYILLSALYSIKMHFITYSYSTCNCL